MVDKGNRQSQSSGGSIGEMEPAAPTDPAYRLVHSPKGSIPVVGFDGSAELHLGLIERFAPPSIVVNRMHDIVHVSKSARKYLRISGGEPSNNLLKLIQPELRAALRLLLFQATNTESAAKSQSLPVHVGEKAESVVIQVEPVDLETRDLFLVIIENQGVKAQPGYQALKVAPEEQSLVRHLEAELDRMRSTWRETVEELVRTNGELHNLMECTRIATIFLDRKLRIEFITPSCIELFNFIPGDHGRPLSELGRNPIYKGISQDAMEVLENLEMIEREVKNSEGNWFLVRLSPYRTAEDKIPGVVITCIDITERKKSQEAHRWLSAIVESSNDAVISFTPDGDIISWNKGAERIFGYTAGEIIGRSQAILAPKSLQDEKKKIIRMLKQGKPIKPFETVSMCKDGKLIDISFSASVIRDDSGEIVGATAIAQDISARKQAVEDLKRARDELEERVKERTAELRKRVCELANMASQLTSAEERERKRLARILHDEFQQMLVSAKMGLQTLDGLDEETRNRETKSLTELLDSLIASSRSLSIELSPQVLSETLGQALEWLCSTWMPEMHKLRVHTKIDLSLDACSEDIRSILFYSVRELLFNVVKHSQQANAYVDLVPHGDGDLKVTVRDYGLGFDIEAEDFKCGKATGFGLIGLRERLEMLGGKFTIHSQPDDGVEAVIIVSRKTNNDE